MTTALSASRITPASTGRWAAHYGLAILFAANLLNYADRTLLGIVIEPVRADLGLSDTQISIVSGIAFIGFNLLIGVFISRWVDRGNRRLILVCGVALWSAATWMTSAAGGFASLAVCRALVGIGEATVFPVALSLIADYYAAPARPRTVSIFQSSAGVGLVAGSILAGLLAARYGWRHMFEICGVAGVVVIALIAFTLREPARGQQEAETGGRPAGSGAGRQAVVESPALGLGAALAALWKSPGFAWLAFGYGASNMALAVLPTWAPAFLLRTHGVQLAQVGAIIGPAAGLGGLAGTILSGLIATRLIKRSGNELAGLHVPIVGLVFAAPAFAVFLFAPSVSMLIAAIGVMNICLSSSLGPCLALAVGRVPVGMRGLTATVMLIVQGLLGAALAPLIVGVVSDLFAPSVGGESLRYALSLIIAAPLVASWALWVAYRRMQRG